MSWLPKKTRDRTDIKIDHVNKSALEAQRSYDRMIRSLKDLEEILKDVDDAKRGPDSKRS